MTGGGFAAINARKTECAHGHPLSGENLLPNKQGYRICAACQRASLAKSREKARARRSQAREDNDGMLPVANALKKAEARFHDSYTRNEYDECWPWHGSFLSTGYGRFNILGTTIPAPRAMRLLISGDLPPSVLVCHTCDNRRCVNPYHLFLGSVQDNVDDMIRKGRKVVRRGSTSLKAKIREDDVHSIRQSKESAADLARKYGVTPGAVWHIRQRHTWAHLTDQEGQ